MKNKSLPTVLFVAALVFNPLVAGAQSTYTTMNGEVNLLAGLTNLTSVTAINTINQSVGISYITDSSWSATGIENLGFFGTSAGGTLAGTFGGANYFASSNNVALIGVGGPAPLWGSWTVRLLLSDDSYSSPISYSNSDLVRNPSVLTDVNALFFRNAVGQSASPPAATNTYYQLLNIAAFDTGNIGVKGIELSNMGVEYPDITYIGVTSLVPEPSTCASLLAGLACGGYLRFCRRRAR